ncbi:MAG: sigma-70 family RNA polymerase sigma factor [Planktothrix sp.]|uniref:sigma-70 family RNA polymerase sigma factor n=1 Tax=Planktothrix sp. TaxID=3088171 RepID=UPI0038D3A699
MQTLHLPESSHPLVKSLFHHKDQELLTLFQNYPDQGKYFVAIFCRYALIVYTLIRHSVRSPVQADYLFSQTWRHIFYEMRPLNLREQDNTEGGTTLQNWLINITAICINQADLPPVESIQYSLSVAPPPLWCYVGLVLDTMEPLLRLILVMAQTFHWSETRISAYLQAEGESVSPNEVKELLKGAYRALGDNLPADIREIYFNDQTLASPLEENPDQRVFKL